MQCKWKFRLSFQVEFLSKKFRVARNLVSTGYLIEGDTLTQAIIKQDRGKASDFNASCQVLN